MTGARHKESGWLTRERGRAIAFLAIAGAVVWLSWLVTEPMVGPITWALALAVLALPLHQWLAGKLKRHNVAAGLTTALVAIMLVVPTTLAVRQIGQEAVGAASKVQASIKDGTWNDRIERNPTFKKAFAWLSGVFDPQEQFKQLSEYVPNAVQKVLVGSVTFAAGVAIALVLLYFFLCDRERMLGGLRALLPLSEPESTHLFRRVADTIHAVLYGTLAVALIQGVLGGLMFWWLGLPAPILWGSAMAVLAIVPIIGTAIIWGPAAIYLLMQGSPEKALILAAWGAIVVGLVDNLLQPAIVKDRLHAPFVPVFIAMIGGLAAFGASGVILGPVLLAVAVSLIDISRERAASGET
jgi:predicted PurR-regulated permease PerM